MAQPPKPTPTRPRPIDPDTGKPIAPKPRDGKGIDFPVHPPEDAE